MSYAAGPTFSAATAVTAWSAPVVVIVAATGALAAYATGVIVLRRRGVDWPLGRTVSWVVGVVLVVFALASGLGTYDGAVFSAHMVQHMLLSMVAPLPLALGAPVTLALRALTGKRRAFLLWLVHTPGSRVLSNPIVALCLFVGSTFALYFTGIYPYSLEHPWAHDLVHLHNLTVGCLFAWVVVGVDPLPRRPGFGMRMLLVVATLPFHAFLGIALLTQTTVIAAPHYLATGQGYVALLDDQRTGAGLLWASGEIIGLALVFAILAQWMGSEGRAATRVDRHLDREEALARLAARRAAVAEREREEDAALTAYNKRLAALRAQG